VSGEARRLIAVDGIDGSGKSMLADRLVGVLAQAGMRAVVLRVDDFRRPIVWGQDARAEADLYYEDYYDLALLERGARAFLKGDSRFELPVFDPLTERHQGRRTIAFDGAPLALIEGVFAQRLAPVREGAAIIYIETSRDEARRRILARDTVRGRTIADVTHRIQARYFPAQDRYLREHDPLANADALIVHERTGAPELVRADAGRLGGALFAALGQVVGSFAPSGPVG
jgi:uridine kinase